jgi:hypothetical protein
LLILLALTQAACSYLTDFVVINESRRTIEVRYKVKEGSSDPLWLTGTPAKRPVSQLRDRNNGWVQQELAASQYQIDKSSRTVMVSVLPGEALRVATVHDYRWSEDYDEEGNYPIEEIRIVGAGGEMKFTGQHARTAFSEVSRTLYTLTYQ